MSQITEQEKDIQSALLDMARAAGFTEKEFHTIQAALEKGATLADVFNISKDTLEVCPKCGSKNLDYLTRVIGYLKRVSSFSEMRQEEAQHRFYVSE